MTQWPDDESLLHELGDAVHGEVSDHRRAAAHGAFVWRTIDEDLMHLTHDSSTDLAASQVRSSTSARVVGFQGADLTLEVEIDGDTVMGQVVPGRRCRVTMRTPDGGPVVVDTDESGIFSLGVPTGRLVRFLVEYDDTRRTTEWLTPLTTELG